MTVTELNKRLNYEIPVSLRAKVRIAAKQKGQTVQYYLRQAISAIVDTDLEKRDKK